MTLTSSIDSSSRAPIDESLLQSVPLLEAFGNAKMEQNDNSSRFGKLPRLHFNQASQLANADIEVFLLEKSRLFHQLPGQRSFHVFYQLLAGGSEDMHKKLFLTGQGPSLKNGIKMIISPPAHSILGI